MFSSTELISFVFANETDTYFGEDLIKRDLNQYLWDRLHQNYDAVYFLSAEANGFAIHTYGDLCCREYVPRRKTLFSLLGSGSAQNEFGNWLQRQLRGKAGETAAFVCPLEDFCTVLGDSQWDSVLTEIAEMKNRTGIFVLTASATVEKTAKLLLESPVFEKLQETAVTDLRSGAMQKLYGALKNRKWDHCVFLNTFSWERLRTMLLHLVLEHPDRCESCSKLDELTEYLYAYCRNPAFADQEAVFHREMPVDYLLYANLYDQLSTERTWKKFESASKNYQRQEYFRENTKPAATRLPVLRDRNSYAGRCMRIKLPGWIVQKEETAEESAGLLHRICDAVSSPMNRVENPEIISAAEYMLNQLDAAYNCDTETYLHILGALKFCVDHVYTQSEKETEQLLEVIQKHRDLISICQQHFILERELNLSRSTLTEGKMHSVALQQMEAKLFTLEQLKKKYLDLVSAMELGLKMPVAEGNIKTMLENLEQEIEHFGRLSRDPEVAGPSDEEPEEEYILTSEFYDFRPPVVQKAISNHTGEDSPIE